MVRLVAMRCFSIRFLSFDATLTKHYSLTLTNTTDHPIVPNFSQCYTEIMNVMIVDDEQAICDALSRKLKREGYDVVVCQNGLDAICAFHSERS